MQPLCVTPAGQTDMRYKSVCVSITARSFLTPVRTKMNNMTISEIEKRLTDKCLILQQHINNLQKGEPGQTGFFKDKLMVLKLRSCF